MKGSRLEVFLVSAKGIKQTSLIAKPAYYVVTECGNQVRRSKISKGFRIAGNRNEICWNEKFIFEFPNPECENLTYLKFTIMDEEYFGNGGKFVGKTMIYLKTIIMEGNDRGFIELTPSRYNVVLEDDTYKGELKIGLRFIPDTDIDPERREPVEEDEVPEETICKTLMNLWKVSWWRCSQFCRNLDNEDKRKET